MVRSKTRAEFVEGMERMVDGLMGFRELQVTIIKIIANKAYDVGVRHGKKRGLKNNGIQRSNRK